MLKLLIHKVILRLYKVREVRKFAKENIENAASVFGAVMPMCATVSWDVILCSLVVTDVSDGHTAFTSTYKTPSTDLLFSHGPHSHLLVLAATSIGTVVLAVSVYPKPSIRRGVVYLTTKTRVCSGAQCGRHRSNWQRRSRCYEPRTKPTSL